MPTDDSVPVPPARKSGLSLTLWVPVVLVLYALSPAPVILLVGKRTTAALEAFYAPLVYLYDQVPLVHSFYDWYFQLWGIK